MNVGSATSDNDKVNPTQPSGLSDEFEQLDTSAATAEVVKRTLVAL